MITKAGEVLRAKYYCDQCRREFYADQLPKRCKFKDCRKSASGKPAGRPRTKCECNEKDAEVCRYTPECQPSYCRVKANLIEQLKDSAVRHISKQMTDRYGEIGKTVVNMFELK